MRVECAQKLVCDVGLPFMNFENDANIDEH